MDNDDNVILYGHPDSNYTYLDGSPKDPHTRPQTDTTLAQNNMDVTKGELDALEIIVNRYPTDSARTWRRDALRLINHIRKQNKTLPEAHELIYRCRHCRK